MSATAAVDSGHNHDEDGRQAARRADGWRREASPAPTTRREEVEDEGDDVLVLDRDRAL